MALGPRALIDIAVPVGVDASEVWRVRMEGGITPLEVVQLAATTIGEANDRLENLYGGLLSYTETNFARYRNGTSGRRKTPKKSEFSKNDPIRGEQIGHMLPREDFSDAIGGSVEWFRRADRELVRFDIDEVRDAWIDRIDYDVVKRLLSNAENQIGTAGYDVPWVNGTGGNVDFVPPAWGGINFLNTHTHFVRTNSAISTTTTASTLNTMAGHLSEHGHTLRKVAYISQADIANYTGITGGKWAPLVPGEFRVLGGSTAAQFTATAAGEITGMPGELIGYYNSDYGVVEVRWHPRIPTTYLWMGVSYGRLDKRNPLLMRLDKGIDFGLRVNPQIDRSIKPQMEAIAFDGTHGVGVNDRTNGVAAQIASGGATYTDPTIA
jgi:hypothetical protein